MMITISNEILRENGYHTYTQNGYDPNYYLNFYQKRFLDDRGNTKYFINIKETSGFDPDVDDEKNHNWWPTLNLNLLSLDGEDERFFSIDLVQWFNNSGQYSEINIGEMEMWCEYLFHSLDCLYYKNVWAYTEKELIEMRTDFIDNFYIQRIINGESHYVKKLSFSFVLNKILNKGYTEKELINYKKLLDTGQYNICYEMLK